jgi:hypothetical protein
MEHQRKREGKGKHTKQKIYKKNTTNDFIDVVDLIELLYVINL